MIDKRQLKLMAVIGAARYVAEEVDALRGVHNSIRQKAKKQLGQTVETLIEITAPAYNRDSEDFQKDMYPIIEIIEGALENNAYVQQLPEAEREKFVSEINVVLEKYGIPTST